MSIDPFEGAIPSGAEEETRIANNPKVQYAGFWIRFVASVIDSILIMIVIVPIIEFFFSRKRSISGSMFDGSNMTAYNFESLSTLSGTGQLVQMVLVLIVIMLFWIYRAATPGKMLLGLKIVDAESLKPLSKQQGIVRYLGYYVSILFFAMGFIWAGFDRRKQAWHDKMAGTLVIYTDNKEKSPD